MGFRSKSLISNASANSLTATEPAGAAQDDILIAIHVFDTSSANVSTGVGNIAYASSGWTQIGTTIVGASASEVSMWWIRRGATAPTLTQSTNLNCYCELEIMAFSGVPNTGSPFGATPVQNTTTQRNPNNPDCPSITTTTNGSLVLALGVGYWGVGTAFTAPSGYTLIEGNVAGGTICTAYKVVGTAGAENPGAFGGGPSNLEDVAEVTVELLQTSSGTTIGCNIGTITYSGKTASIFAGTLIGCALGAITYTGLQAAITVGGNTVINGNVGAITYSGKTASIYIGYDLAWDASVDPNVTGYAVVWDTTSHAAGTYSDYAFSADAGNVLHYVISGLTMGTTYYARVVSYITFGDTGTYGVSAERSFVAGATYIDAFPGSITYVGKQASVAQGVAIACNLGSITYVGKTASVGSSSIIDCQIGQIAYATYPATINQGTTVSCALGQITYAGLQASIFAANVVTCQVGSITYAGLQATLFSNQRVDCNVGAINYVPKTATIIGAVTILCNTGSITYAGLRASIKPTIDIYTSGVFMPVFSRGVTGRYVGRYE